MTCLIWDIQEEHLDEAEFLLEMWTSCADSPRFTLARLRDGPERRLLARLDGLVVGGAVVVDRLLLPVLARPEDEFRTAAATLAILQGAGLDACARVLTGFDNATRAGRRGVVRGLSLAQRTGLIQWLGRDLEQLRGSELADRLLVLAAHRVDVGARLITCLNADELEVRRAAASLARHTRDAAVLRQLAASFHAQDHALRWAAIESGLIRGLPGAWEFVWEEAQRPDSSSRKAALAWLAMLGNDATHQRLFAALAAGPSPDLVWAVGLSGRVGAVDAVLELLGHPRLARLAGEVVCAVAGLSPTADRCWLDRGVSLGSGAKAGLPDLRDDNLEADLAPGGDDALRLPNPEPIRAWWAQQRGRLDPRLRHIGGRPLDREQLIRSLTEQPTRRRHPLALELAARTGGVARASTWAPTAVQRAQLDDAFARAGTLDLQAGLAPTR